MDTETQTTANPGGNFKLVVAATTDTALLAYAAVGHIATKTRGMFGLHKLDVYATVAPNGKGIVMMVLPEAWGLDSWKSRIAEMVKTFIESNNS